MYSTILFDKLKPELNPLQKKEALSVVRAAIIYIIIYIIVLLCYYTHNCTFLLYCIFYIKITRLIMYINIYMVIIRILYYSSIKLNSRQSSSIGPPGNLSCIQCMQDGKLCYLHSFVISLSVRRWD